MRGSIIKRGKTYTIILELGRDPTTGKRKQKWIGGFAKIKEAEKELARLITELNKGTYIEPTISTLGEYLEKWLDIHKDTVAEITFIRYHQFINAHIIPLIGNMQLAKIKPMHIQQFLAEMKTRERLDGRKGTISPTTIHHCHNLLHKALKDAVKWQMISTNPASAVTPPKRKKKECRVAIEEQIPVILDATRNTYLEVPAYLALSTGARLGEILGLQWNDVDLKKGVVYIRQSLSRKKDGTLVLGMTKTPKSRRAIEIGADTIAELKRHQKKQLGLKMANRSQWGNNNYVCCHENGHPINPNGASSRFKKLMRKVGLDFGFHDLRHTHATMLLKAGVNPKIVSERLGHSTIGMTLDTYSHVLPTMQQEAARIMDSLLTLR